MPIRLLAVWDPDQKEPWYLATTLFSAAPVEQVYRWRMRLECANRDEKTGVILREGGDQHALRNVVHLHRLLLSLCAAEWLCALTGLQAHTDLPAAAAPPPPISTLDDLPVPPLRDTGPADPPPIVPHRGERPKPPPWLKRFVAWGPLSGVPFGSRLGREVLRAPDLRGIVQHLTRWLADYLWFWTPLWNPAQLRYRRRAWWSNTS